MGLFQCTPIVVAAAIAIFSSVPADGFVAGFVPTSSFAGTRPRVRLAMLKNGGTPEPLCACRPVPPLSPSQHDRVMRSLSSEWTDIWASQRRFAYAGIASGCSMRGHQSSTGSQSSARLTVYALLYTLYTRCIIRSREGLELKSVRI